VQFVAMPPKGGMVEKRKRKFNHICLHFPPIAGNSKNARLHNQIDRNTLSASSLETAKTCRLAVGFFQLNGGTWRMAG
jgi:hypothetical protein